MTGEKACLAFSGAMIRIKQIKHDFGPRHFGFADQRQFHIALPFKV